MLKEVKEDQGHICFPWVGGNQGSLDGGVGIWRNLKPLLPVATADIKHGLTPSHMNTDLNDRWAFCKRGNRYAFRHLIGSMVREYWLRSRKCEDSAVWLENRKYKE